MKKTILCPVLLGLLAAPLLAGDLHGKVACKGVRDSSDAVVSIGAIPGKTFPAPKEHGKIDQANLVEKGQEVARMGQIYNKASRVVVWLGPEDESTPLALDIIQRISAGVELTWHHRGIHRTLPGSEAQILEQRPEDSTLSSEHWTALSRFLRRPWFSRLWIRQEVQLASQV